mgnify:CR=1 FL=1
MSQNKINIAILLGDPSGIGPELVTRLLSEEITNKANIIVIGEKNILENGKKISGKTNNLKFVNSFDEINYSLVKTTNPDIKVSASDIQLLIDEVLNKPTVWVDSPDTDRFTTNYDGV